MKKADKTKKRLLSEALKMAKDLHKAGALDGAAMKEFDALCLSEVHELTPIMIKRIL